jgi:tetratricopeptide (TPR) repeat protein
MKISAVVHQLYSQSPRCFTKKVYIRYACLLICIFLIKNTTAANDKYDPVKIDSLKRVLAHSTNDSAIATSMRRLAMIYRRINSDSAHFWSQQLIDFGKKKNMLFFVGVGHMIRGNVYRFDNDFEKSIKYYRLMLSDNQQIKDNEGIAQAYGCLMKVELMRAGSADSIRYYFDKVMELKDSMVTDERIIPDTYADFSEFLMGRGDHRIAMDYLQQAIRMYENSKDEKRILFAKVALAQIHMNLNNQEKADQLYKEILPKALELKSYPIYATILCSIGEGYLAKKELGKAQEFFYRSLSTSEKYNSQENLDRLFSLMAALKIEMHQTDSAVYFANKALRVVKSTSPGHAANLELAKAYTQKGDFKTAENYAQRFLKEHLKEDRKGDVANAYKVLFDLYEKWGNYPESIRYHHLYEDVKSKLYSEENSNRIADMEAWYWGMQKRNELSLAKKNEELKTREIKEALIEKQLYESQRNGLIIGSILVIIFSILLYKIDIQAKKNKLMRQVTDLELKAIRAQMNPHFLFNALSAIQMLINKSDIRQANEGLAKFGKLMRLILENSEKQTISIGDEVKTLELYVELEALRFPFNYKFSIDSIVDKENMEIPSMIIQPYIENAIKHGISGKQDEKEIAVEFKQVGTQLFCTIQDNGIGRMKAQKTRSKYAQHKSMGTKLSSDRLALISKQISGKADVVIKDLYTDAGDPSGTLVELNIPITYFEN